MKQVRDGLRAGRREPGALAAQPGQLLLAIESATQVASVALLRGDALIAELTSCDERPHSERLLPLIDEALALAGAELAQIAAFAISAGPGSFTGLRVGIATLKGLAFGSALPVAPVSTLAALAAAAVGATGPVAALLDARRGEVYAGCFAAPGDDTATLAESVYTPEVLARELPEAATIVVGEGAEAAAAELAALRLDLQLLAPAQCRASAARVAQLGRRLLAQGGGVDAAALRPRYLRRAEAEARRTGQPLESFDTSGVVS